MISDLTFVPSKNKHPKYKLPCYSYKKYMQKYKDSYNALIEKPSVDSEEYKMMKINKSSIELLGKSELKLNFLNLAPKVNATHAIILISGWLSENSDKMEEWRDVLNHPFTPVAYSYIWSSCKNIEGNGYFKKAYDFAKKVAIFDEYRRKAEESGKLLAYALMSNFVFKKQSISLMGFSLGTCVIIR